MQVYPTCTKINGYHEKYEELPCRALHIFTCNKYHIWYENYIGTQHPRSDDVCPVPSQSSEYTL